MSALIGSKSKSANQDSRPTEELCEMPTRLWRIPVGGRFYDFYGKQIFEKIGECTSVKTRQRLHVLRCEQSPFTVLPGPVCAAFFCAIGDVVFRGGNLLVFRFIAGETPALPGEAA